MTALKLLALALSFVAWLGVARPARGKERGFLTCEHVDPDGAASRYVLFVPHSYAEGKPQPLLLFLHGAGETGDDGQRQAEIGLGPAIRKREAHFPFLTVFPQSQERTWQANSSDARRALAILAEVRKRYSVDPRRIYLTGLSMGGFGTWSLATRYPRRWAAIVPICGGGNLMKSERIKNMPCWCFHGEQDNVVDVEKSREMIHALRAAGGKPKYTEYAGVGHNSWDRAYATPGLYAWLLKQQRKRSLV